LKDSNVRIKILQLAHAAASGDDDSFREVGRAHLNGDYGTIRTSEIIVASRRIYSKGRNIADLQ
jgi:hypothetical protein